MNDQQIKEFIEENWRDESALRSLIGVAYSGVDVWHFGDIPTNKIAIDTEQGCISRIRAWSGLNWSARGGYGRPFMSIKYRERQT